MFRYASLMVALCGILRSTDLLFRTKVVEQLNTLTIISWEHIINFALVLPYFFIKRDFFKKLTAKDILLFCLIGFGASAMGILCFTQAFHYINPALAILLQKLQPIITIVFGCLLLKERISARFVFWALVAIASSYFVSFGLVNPFSGEWHKIAKGAFFAVAAAFFWGGGTIWGKILLKKYEQFALVVGRFLFGFIFTVSLTFIFGKGLEFVTVTQNSYHILIQLTYMAIISGFLATTFFYIGLNNLTTSVASILELIFPISSVLIMWFYFNRPLSNVQIFAAVILFFAMYKINLLQAEHNKE